METGAVLVHTQPVHEAASSKGGCHVRFAVPRPGSGGATRRSIGHRGRHPHRRLSRPGRRPGSRRCGRLWRGARGAPTPGCPGQHRLRRPDPADRPRRGVQRDHHRHRHHRYGRGDPAGQRRRQRSSYRGHREFPAWRARARTSSGSGRRTAPIPRHYRTTSSHRARRPPPRRRRSPRCRLAAASGT